MDTVLIDTRLGKLFDAGLSGRWFVSGHVNLDDLCSMRPGSIVRCSAPVNECVKFVPFDASGIEGCIAGWISEDEDGPVSFVGMA